MNGCVWQTVRVTGSVETPVSAATTIGDPSLPAFTVATANAREPVAPAIDRIPSFVVVLTRATISGTGLAVAEINSVLRPVTRGAAAELAQRAVIATSDGSKGADGVTAKTKDRNAFGAMLKGAFGEPAGALVDGTVS